MWSAFLDTSCGRDTAAVDIQAPIATPDSCSISCKAFHLHDARLWITSVAKPAHICTYTNVKMYSVQVPRFWHHRILRKQTRSRWDFYLATSEEKRRRRAEDDEEAMKLCSLSLYLSRTHPTVQAWSGIEPDDDISMTTLVFLCSVWISPRPGPISYSRWRSTES